MRWGHRSSRRPGSAGLLAGGGGPVGPELLAERGHGRVHGGIEVRRVDGAGHPVPLDRLADRCSVTGWASVEATGGVLGAGLDSHPLRVMPRTDRRPRMAGVACRACPPTCPG